MDLHPFAGISFHDVASFGQRSHETIMEHGTTPQLDSLENWEFREYNPPAFSRVLGFQKFVKGFFRDGDRLAGYNLFVDEGRAGLNAAWLPRDRAGIGTDERGRHGFYDIEPASGLYPKFPRAVLLNYGSGRNGAFNPEARIRDYLVQVGPNNPDIFLGKAYLRLGALDVFSNFFVLERFRPTAGTGAAKVTALRNAAP